MPKSHEPASIAALRDWRDSTQQRPLWNVPGRQTGFVMASRFINWEDFEDRGRSSWKIIAEEGDTLWAPDPAALQQAPSGNFEWSSDEEQYFDDIWGNEVISHDA